MITRLYPMANLHPEDVVTLLSLFRVVYSLPVRSIRFTEVGPPPKLWVIPEINVRSPRRTYSPARARTRAYAHVNLRSGSLRTPRPSLDPDAVRRPPWFCRCVPAPGHVFRLEFDSRSAKTFGLITTDRNASRSTFRQLNRRWRRSTLSFKLCLISVYCIMQELVKLCVQQRRNDDHRSHFVFFFFLCVSEWPQGPGRL